MCATSHNKAFNARVYKVCVPNLVPDIKVPVVHLTDSVTSTAREKDFAGPVQERRDGMTLSKITMGALRNRINYYKLF